MPLSVPLLFMGVPLLIVVVFAVIARQHRRVGREMRTVPAGWVRAPFAGVVTAEETWVSRHGTPGSTTSAVVHRPIVTYRAGTGADVTFRRIGAVFWVLAVVILVPLVVVFEGVGWFLLTHR